MSCSNLTELKNEHLDAPPQESSWATLRCAEDFGKKMAERRKDASGKFKQIAKSITDEARVKEIVYQDRGLCGSAIVWGRNERIAKIYVPQPTTRRRLYIFAHECGHAALDHHRSIPSHRREFEAEQWAISAMRAHGVSVPRKSLLAAKKYVAHKIDMAVRRRAKQIDRESLRFCEDYLSFEVRQWLATGGKLSNLGNAK